MTVEILIQIVLFGIALSMDAFAVAVTDGLTYSDMNKKKGFFIAGVFGVMQALMPLTGYWLVEGISVIVGEAGGEKAGEIMSNCVSWLSFLLLLYIGGRMLIEAILVLRKKKNAPEGEEVTSQPKTFSYKEVIIYGFATAIDALATGVAFHNVDANGVSMSTNSTIWLHACIIMCCTFIISLIGVTFGHFFEKLLKGKYEITGIIGGCILIILGFWVILSHYFGL